MPDSASSSRARGLRTAAPTGTVSTGLPAKRAISTCLSAATMMQLAAVISSGVRRFFTPSAPLVSTFSRTSISAAAFCSASAARKVWASPSGQAVTASSL